MKYTSVFFTFFCIAIILVACNKDNFYEGSTPNVSASLDTLLFDTVFTEVGSATREFKIYNKENEDVLISLALDNNNNSPYKLNVNGLPGNAHQDVRIRANDSIYVFATVTIDPDQPLSVSPFVVDEYITITSEDTEEKVLLESFGQNANYIPGRKSKGLRSLLSCDLGEITWNDPKPYVIYGILFIDSCNLVLPAGTDIYVHGGIVKNDNGLYNDGIIYVFENGSIEAQGTVDQPVTLQGDRLEDGFKIGGGQWAGVIFGSKSKNNSLKHTQLKNSIIGYRVDSLAELSLDACEIGYTSGQGLIGYHSTINVTNSLIHHNGLESVALSYGGNYNFKHTTISSFGNKSKALAMSNFTCFDPNDCANTLAINKLSATMTNNIIVGNDRDELSIADGSDGMLPQTLDFTFDHCIVRVDDFIKEQYPNFLIDDCPGCINYDLSDTLFVEQVTGDFALDTLSIAVDRGVTIPGITDDIIGTLRDEYPDMGCYEYIYE